MAEHDYISFSFPNTLQNNLISVLINALIVHFIFNRWELLSIPLNSFLLFGIPNFYAFLLTSHFNVLSSVIIAYGAFYATLFTSIVLYRISPAHSLARYPGPFLAKISKWWIVYQARKKDPLTFVNLHDEYGDVVRVGPNDLSIRDVDTVVPLLGSQGLPKNASWSGRGMHQKIPSLVGYRDPVAHAKRRRPWNRAFSMTAIKEYQPWIQQRVSQFVDRVGKQQGVIDITQWIRYYSHDFMGDMVFGGGTELLRDGDPEHIVEVVQNGLTDMLIYAELPWISYYTKHIPRASTKTKGMRSMALTRTAERYKHGSMYKDLFYYLSNEDGAEQASPPREIVIADGVLALVAGSETTAGALSITIRYLLLYPEVYNKLQFEIDKFYPPGEDSVDPKHHKDMYYLEGVLNEVLRLSPVLPAGSERAPWVGKGDVAFGQYYIPEGTNVKLNTLAVHTDSRYWSYPSVFWPERWAIAEGILPAPGDFVHTPNAFIPFSFGPSNCVGKHAAMLNMRIFLCHVLQKHEIRIPDKMPKEEWKRVARVGKSGHFSLPVQVRNRD